MSEFISGIIVSAFHEPLISITRRYIILSQDYKLNFSKPTWVHKIEAGVALWGHNNQKK